MVLAAVDSQDVSVKPTESVVFVGESLTLTCITNGSKPHWLFQDVTGSSSGIPSASLPAAVENNNSSQLSKLTVDNIALKYGGIYICQALVGAEYKTSSTAVAVIGEIVRFIFVVTNLLLQFQRGTFRPPGLGG